MICQHEALGLLCSATARSSTLHYHMVFHAVFNALLSRGSYAPQPPRGLPWSAYTGPSKHCHHEAYHTLPTTRSSLLHYQVVFHVVFNALQQRGLLCTATTRSSMLWHHEVWHTPLPRDLPYSAIARSSMLCHQEGFHAQSPRGFSCPAITSSLMLCCLLCTATTRSYMHRYHGVFHALPSQGLPCYFLGGLPCYACARSSMLFPWRSSTLCHHKVFYAFSLGGLPWSAPTMSSMLFLCRSSMLWLHKAF